MNALIRDKWLAHLCLNNLYNSIGTIYTISHLNLFPSSAFVNWIALNLSLSFPSSAIPPFLADRKKLETTLCCPSSRLLSFLSMSFQAKKGWSINLYPWDEKWIWYVRSSNIFSVQDNFPQLSQTESKCLKKPTHYNKLINKLPQVHRNQMCQFNSIQFHLFTLSKNSYIIYSKERIQ